MGTMPGPSRPTVLTPTPDGASPTTPRSTPARFRPTTISGLRTTTAGPPRTRRATATLPLLELTLLLASTFLTATLPPTTVTDTTDTDTTATATVAPTDGEYKFSPLRLMMCIRSQ